MDRALEYLSSVILTASYGWIPLCSASGKPRVPWWSPEYSAAIQDRKHCFRRFHYTGVKSDFIALFSARRDAPRGVFTCPP